MTTFWFFFSLSSPRFDLLLLLFYFFFHWVRSSPLGFFFFFLLSSFTSFGLLLGFFFFFFSFFPFFFHWVQSSPRFFFFFPFTRFGWSELLFFFSLPSFTGFGFRGTKKKKSCTEWQAWGPQTVWKILSDDKWVIVPNSLGIFEWWMISDGNWVTEIEWWKKWIQTAF